MDEAVYTFSLPLSPIIVFYDLDYLGDVKEIQIQKKIRELYLPRFNFSGATLFKGTLFKIIILGRKIAISPQPSIRLTSDQSVNSSLSVVVQ